MLENPIRHEWTQSNKSHGKNNAAKAALFEVFYLFIPDHSAELLENFQIKLETNDWFSRLGIWGEFCLHFTNIYHHSDENCFFAVAAAPVASGSAIILQSNPRENSGAGQIADIQQVLIALAQIEQRSNSIIA